MKCLWLLLISLLVFACDGKQDNTDDFDINRSKNSLSTTARATEIVDLESKGVGPIKSVNIDSSIDQDMAGQGNELFNTYCTTCHKLDVKFVGPALRAVTKRRSPEWIMNMILNPGRMIRDDSLAKAVFMEFNGSPMTNVGFEESEARAVLEYLRTQ